MYPTQPNPTQLRHKTKSQPTDQPPTNKPVCLVSHPLTPISNPNQPIPIPIAQDQISDLVLVINLLSSQLISLLIPSLLTLHPLSRTILTPLPHIFIKLLLDLIFLINTIIILLLPNPNSTILFLRLSLIHFFIPVGG